MSAPGTWNLDCPWCSFYIVAAQESGAGEKAASMMTDHLMARHPGKNWMDFLGASKSVAGGAPSVKEGRLSGVTRPSG